MFEILKGINELKQWMTNHQLHSSSIDMSTFSSVSNIKSSIISDGDLGVCRLTKQFDQVSLTPNELKISKDQCKSAYNEVDDSLIKRLSAQQKILKNIISTNSHVIGKN